MMGSFDTCALCPRLCRHACPVELGTGREAAAPTQIAGVLLDWERGAATEALARSAATLCVDCGACQDACHLHVPLPERLREARAKLLPVVEAAALGQVEGEGEVVLVLTDARPLGPVVARMAGRPVAVLRTADALGEARLAHAGAEAHLAAVAGLLAGRELWVLHGGVMRVLQAAGLRATWLWEAVSVGEAVRGSCCGGESAGQRCCGAAGPLVAHHPEDAKRMAKRWRGLQPELIVGDTRCAALLREVEPGAKDLVDHLLAR